MSSQRNDPSTCLFYCFHFAFRKPTFITNKQQNEYRKTKAEAARIEKAKQDSIIALRKPAEDSAQKVMDSVTKVSNVGNFSKALDSTEKLAVVENKLMKIIPII